MSHFLVLVAGENVEEQLHPFWELDLSQKEAEEDPRSEFQDYTESLLEGWEKDTENTFYSDSTIRMENETEFAALLSLPIQELVTNFTIKEPFFTCKTNKIIKFYMNGNENEAWFRIVKCEDIDKQYVIDMMHIAPPEEVPVKKVYATMEEYAEKHHGYHKNSDGKYGYYSNPNAKWDWFVVGGRWTGELKLKEIPLLTNDQIEPIVNGFTLGEIQSMVYLLQQKPEKFKAAIEKYGPEKAQQVMDCVRKYAKAVYPKEACYGELGTFDSLDVREGKKSIEDIQRSGYCDSTLKKHVDVAGMETPLRLAAEKEWDGFHEKRPTLTLDGNKDVGFGFSYSDLFLVLPEPDKDNPFHGSYKTLPEEMRKWINDNMGFMGGYDELKRIATMSREEYVACRSIWSPYALLWDGKWYGKGDMGWWGMSGNEDSQWKGSFRELWEQIPEDTLISIVDCHI